MTDTNEARPVPEDAPIYATDAEDFVERMHATRRRLLAEELRQERGRVWQAMYIMCEHIRDFDESGHEAIAGLAVTVQTLDDLADAAEHGELVSVDGRTDEQLREDFERKRRRQEASDA